MRKIIIAVFLVGLASFGIGMYFWNKPVASLDRSSPDVSVPASKLMDDFETDEDSANDIYLGKVVEVSGVLKEVKGGDNGTQVVLETESMLGGVTCSFAKGEVTPEDLAGSIGKSIRIKGECTGYLMDVILERCVLSE